MIYTVAQYSKIFSFSSRKVSGMTIRRKCRDGLLPSNHHAIKLGDDKDNCPWIIEVPDDPSNDFDMA